MELKPIRTEEDYEAALVEIERLLNAEPGTPDEDRLDVISTLVGVYEDEHYPIPAPDPIEAIEYHMERLGMTRKDLEPFIGGSSRVSEILNRKRPLSITMMRRLNAGLGISMDVLGQVYELSEPEFSSEANAGFTEKILDMIIDKIIMANLGSATTQEIKPTTVISETRKYSKISDHKIVGSNLSSANSALFSFSHILKG